MEHFDWLKGFVFPYINFALFLFLAVKFFKKPIQQALDGRRKDFERLMQEAKSAKDAAEAKNNELKQRLAKLDSEISLMKAKAKEAAETEAKAMLARAQRLSEQLKEEAKRMAEAEVKNARDQLRREIVEEVKGVVTKRLREVSDGEQTAILKKKISAIASIRAGA